MVRYESKCLFLDSPDRRIMARALARKNSHLGTVCTFRRQRPESAAISEYFWIDKMIQHFKKVPYFGITLTDLSDVASISFYN